MDSSLLFNRFASLKVQSRRGVFESSAGRPVVVERDFAGLRIQFQVEKTSESNPNQARISVYNLSSDSRGFVQEAGQTVVLEVGYAPQGEPETKAIIFQGDVPPGGIRSERKGPDWVTSFEVGDAQKKLKEQKFDRTYESGASLKKILGDVAGSLGLAVNSIKGVKDKTFKSGVTLSGGVKDIMDSLTRDADTEWSVQDNEVQILGRFQATDEDAIVVSPQTGLIQSPVKRAEDIEFTTLLIPTLRPGRLVDVQSRDVNGFYRIRKVMFNGDSLEGEWTAKCECVVVRP